MIYAFTGHRGDKLGGYSPQADARVIAFARHAIPLIASRHGSVERAIVGMALGWDMAVAQACVDLGLPYVAAVPCPGQASRWPKESQDRWQRLLDKAVSVTIVSDAYSAAAMQVRNQWMVDRAGKVVALWNGSPGGTANCVEYARRKGVPVLNCWSRWQEFQSQ